MLQKIYLFFYAFKSKHNWVFVKNMGIMGILATRIRTNMTYLRRFLIGPLSPYKHKNMTNTIKDT